MGSVWLAEHTMLGRRAAIKVLHPAFSTRHKIVRRFFNEARAATAIADPGIVQIFDFGYHVDRSAYIVMELLDGESLERRCARRGVFDVPEALRLVRQVASSLGAAHARGIVHRDLKPSNLFIVRDPEVAGGERTKILDFGIAKLVGEPGGVKTHPDAVMGTPSYMSPEQCRGAGLVDQRSDVYALGCVLFKLLIGRPPFQASATGEIIALQQREAPPVPSSLRPELAREVDQLVLRCLAKDPAQRFAHGGELAAALDGLLRSPSPKLDDLEPSIAFTASESSTTLATAPRATHRPPRRRRAAMLAGLAVCATGGVIALAVLVGGAGPANHRASPAAPPTAGTTAGSAHAADTPDSRSQVAARMKDVLAWFVAWSPAHRGAPCPDAADLRTLPPDPWGQAFRLTCTAQPNTQIVGVISSGPDRRPDTADDIASWQLDREVTDLVRGERWVSAPPVSPTPAAERRDTSGVQLGENRAASKTEAAAPRPRPHSDGIELNKNGLLIKR